jgi:acylphosphatase
MRLDGWVANEQDGSVRCVVEGPEQILRRLLGALAEGPAMSRVDSVSELWSAATGEFEGFRIRSLGHGGD